MSHPSWVGPGQACPRRRREAGVGDGQHVRPGGRGDDRLGQRSLLRRREARVLLGGLPHAPNVLFPQVTQKPPDVLFAPAAIHGPVLGSEVSAAGGAVHRVVDLATWIDIGGFWAEPQARFHLPLPQLILLSTPGLLPLGYESLWLLVLGLQISNLANLIHAF